MAKYLACGNIMSDTVIQKDGSYGALHIGGPAMFALAGIRTFTADCKLVCGAGADYEDSYGKWLDVNGLSRESVRVVCEHCTQHVIRHYEDNSYKSESRFGAEVLGYMKTHPGHISHAISSDTKAFYLAQNDDLVFWKNIAYLKEKTGVKMMWEMESKVTDLERLKRVIFIPEMFSLNHFEASNLFGIPKENDEDIINELMKFGCDLVYYRVGPRGAYAISGNRAVFCESVDPYGESVDPTGCGNCSTGAAMFAFMEGYDLAMTAAIAAVAAGFNAAQYGPVPYVDAGVTETAFDISYEVAQKIRKKYGG